MYVSEKSQKQHPNLHTLPLFLKQQSSMNPVEQLYILRPASHHLQHENKRLENKATLEG